MLTYGQQMIQQFESGLKSLENLSHEGYEPDQIRDLLTSVASKTELFLKSIIFPAIRSRNTFEYFIDELATLGVSQDSRDKLHDLRRKYNQAKHDPNIIIDLISATNILKRANETIEELVTGRYGSVDAEVPRHMNRVYWIAAWDHYIGGDTEVHVIIPAHSEHWLGPLTFDSIYVRMEAVDSIKSELAALGVFSPGDGLIPASQYAAFQSDSDFLGAWVFEGDYRSLITTLAKYEFRQELLPGLNREDDSRSMILAYMMAALDIVTSDPSDTDLALRIDENAKLRYAVPTDYKHSSYLSDSMASMFQLVPASDWSRISGPSWLTKDRFNALIPTCRAKHAKYAILIDSDLILRANFT